MIDIPEESKLTLEQVMVLALMESNEAERLDGWTIELVDRFPSIIDVTERAILGSFSWTLLKSKRKLILASEAVMLGRMYLTPADLARAYLRIKFPNRKPRMTGFQAQAFVDFRSQPPLYCTPCSIQDALYVDLKSAYWNILQTIGWDIEYLPSRFLGVGKPLSDFPFSWHKLARNCLVSCVMPSAMTVWTGTKIVNQKGHNPFLNLMLWGAVCDVLNGIAVDVIKAGAVYVYTDGYIVPVNRHEDVFEAISKWGFPFGVKNSGACTVLAPACYKFPEYRTRKFDVGRTIHYDKIIDRGGDWLRSRFCSFAQSRIK